MRRIRNRLSWRWGVGLGAGALLAYYALVGSPSHGPPELPCSDRLVVLDGGLASRTDRQAELAVEAAAQAAHTAGICQTAFDMVIGTTGGQHVLFTDRELDADVYGAPNERARRSRSQDAYGALRDEIESQLHDWYAQEATTDSATSWLSLGDAIVDHGRPDMQILVLTTGVHQDAGVDLNAPLANGAGVELASTLDIRRAGTGADVLVVGVGQASDDTESPGSTWVSELRSFAEEICLRMEVECAVRSDIAPEAPWDW